MSSDQRTQTGAVRTVLIVEGAANTVILVVKAFVGLATGSTAILGDAIHSLTDVANNGIALIALRLSSAPPDHDHPYGHRKFETLAVFGLATLLTVAAFEIALRAFSATGEPVETHGWSLGLMLGVLGVNVALATWEAARARKLGSDLLHADARHTFSDVLTTIAVIGGWQLAARGFWWLDPLLALGVAGLVFYLAYDLFRRVVPVLVDQVANDPHELIDLIRTVSRVRDVRRVRSRVSGEGPAADVVVTVDPALTIEESHRVANDIEMLLEQELGIKDVTVHIEPGK